MEDHLHVAIQLMQAQRLPEARQLLKQFTKKNAKHADGWFLLGQLERTLQDWPAALDALKRALALSPQSPAVMEYLAMVQLLSNQGREMLPSLAYFAAVLNAAPQASSAVAIAVNLQTLALRCDAPQALVDHIEPFFETQQPQGPERQRLAAGLAIAHYLLNNEASAASYASEALSLKHFAFDADGNAVPGDYSFYHRYVEFIDALLKQRQTYPALYSAAKDTLHVIGESHCLAPAQLTVADRRVQPHLMMGAKAFMFTAEKGESWQFTFKRIVQSLPKDEPIVVMFGEIDCRANEGIMQQWASRPDYAMEPEVAALVAAYVKFVKISQLKRLAPTYIYGVPAPSRVVTDELPAGRSGADLVQLIRHFNACLKAEAQKQELPFLDVHGCTTDSEGWASDGVHLDKVHLTPATVTALFGAGIR